MNPSGSFRDTITLQEEKNWQLLFYPHRNFSVDGYASYSNVILR
jgi:hypothetical protein